MPPADLSISDDRAALEKKLVRKLDLRIMPMFFLLYVLNFLDRSCISAARDNGLADDLKLTGHQYETAISILYIGYISLQIPSNLLLSYTGRPHLYLPACVAFWGMVSALTATCKSFPRLLVIRLLLGIAEAAFFPGALFVLSKWYTRKELSSRMAVLYSGSILSNAMSGLISAAIISKMEGKAGIRAWRWLFIIEGTTTIAFAVFAVFYLPDFPHNSKMLTAEEKTLAVLRMADDSGQSDVEGANGERPIDGVKQAVGDPIVWLFTLCLTASAVGGAFTNFFPTIVGTLGFSHITTLLITIGPWGFAFLCVIGNALHANRSNERFFHLAVPYSIGIVGFVIASFTQNIGARLFALCLETQTFAGHVIVYSWLSNSIRDGPYKRAVALAFVNCVAQLGSVAGAYVWPKAWGPSYWRSNVISLSCFLAAIAAALTVRIVLTRRNQALDRMQGQIHSLLVQDANEGASTSVTTATKDGQEEAMRQSLEARLAYRYLV